MSDFINLESRSCVNSLQIDDKQVWPVLRIYYFFKLRENQYNTTPFKNRLKNYFFKIYKSFYFFNNIFKRRDYIFFSNEIENKEIYNKSQNKLFFEIYEILGRNNVKYFERPLPNFTSLSKYNPSVNSTSLFEIAAVILSKFLKIKKIVNDKLLIQIKADYKIAVNDIFVLKNIEAFRILFKFYFKIVKPKIIFLTDSYNMCHMGMIQAANELNLPTVEIQHGIINYEHPGYNFYNKELKPLVSPRYLLTFGDYVLDEIKKTSLISLENIYSVGHPYIEYMKKVNSQKVNRKGFRFVVGVTLQWTDENNVINFINNVSKNHQDCLFVLIPRIYDRNHYEKFTLSKNVEFTEDYGFYDIVADLDVHVTTYSTCAIEALSFNTPNILLDFDDMATKYFGKIIPESEVNFYVKSESAFSLKLNKSLASDEKTIDNNYVIKNDYKNNFKHFLKVIDYEK